MRKPLSELVVEFLSEQDVSPTSCKVYKSTIDNFVRWVVAKGISFWSIKRADLLGYKASLQNKKMCRNSVDLYLTVVRKLFKWLELRGLYDNIAAGIHSPRRYRGHKKGYLQPEQVVSLLASMDRNTPIGARDYAIISLMVRAGLRRVEICRMSIGDMNAGTPYTLRIQRKGHTEKDCVIGITSKLVAALNDYVSNYRCGAPVGAPLFVSHGRGYHSKEISPKHVSRVIKQYFAKIGVNDKEITGHSLRHTAAILSLKAGATIDEVQQMLGHTSIETTKIYLSAIEEETRINNPAVQVLDTLF